MVEDRIKALLDQGEDEGCLELPVLEDAIRELELDDDEDSFPEAVTPPTEQRRLVGL